MKLLLLALGLFAYSATIECAPLEPSVLDTDLMEFDRLYPKKDMDKIFKKYAYQIHVAYNYLKKPEFADQLEDIEKMMEFQSVLKYLQESKLDVYKMFNAINKELGIDIHFPMADDRKVITGTLVDMMNEMKNLVPKEKIYALYKSKMETSPDYANFVKRLHATEFKDLSMSFMNNAKTKFFIKSAHKNGVPFVKFLEFNAYHYGLLFDDEDVEEEENVTEGVTVPSQEIAARSLQDDLDSFKALIPAAEIEELFYDYLMNDEEFQEMLEYVTSDEFKSLVKEVEDMPEVRKGLDFLVEAGIPAYEMVNKINAYLEMDKIRPLLMKTSYGGLRGFLDKVKKMIPMDKIKELYENKLETSKDFAALVDKLKSEESQQLVNKLMMNEKFQELLKKAQEHGVNVQEVFNFFQEVLGLKFPAMPHSRGIETKNLGQDFLDFVKLIPMGEIKNLVETYMYEDEEFQEAMGYAFSDDFKTIVKYVEKMPEFDSFLNYMEEKGVPAREILDRVNDLFDIELDSQENANSRKIKGGLKGFVKDLKKLLPMKDLKMLYKEKMANSEDFQDFMMRMRSQQTKDFVKKVLAHPKVQELIVKLNDKGIKIDLSMLSM